MFKRLWSRPTPVLVFLVVAYLIGQMLYLKNNSPQKMRATAKVEEGELIQRSTIAGTVVPFRRTIITAPYQGYIRKIFVKVGETVKVGDPIASVAPSLVAGDTVFPLRSPFSGKVVRVNKSEGEFVKSSDESDFIARIDDLKTMFVEANVPELDHVRMEVGLEAVVRASAILDRTYKAVVRELSFAAREQDRWGRNTAVEFPMRLEILDFDAQLQAGMSAIVDIVTFKKEKVLRLRHEFIGRNKDQYFVTLENGKTKPVKLGIQNEEFSEITEGVTAGTVVQKVDFSELGKP